MSTFGTAIRDARKRMGWDQRSLASALRMSDKTIADLETQGRPQWPAALDVLDLMGAYGIEFTEDYSPPCKLPDPEERYFLTLDFRFDQDQDKRVQSISRRMQVVGMSIVRRLNQAKMLACSFDGVELHVPPINKTAFHDVLAEFIETFGTEGQDGRWIDCLVRNEYGTRLTKEKVATDLWDYEI